MNWSLIHRSMDEARTARSRYLLALCVRLLKLAQRAPSLTGEAIRAAVPLRRAR